MRFEIRLAVLTVDSHFINLDFDEHFNSKFKAGDGISKEYFSVKELSYMKKEFKINKLPFEIYDLNLLNDIFKFMRQ